MVASVVVVAAASVLVAGAVSVVRSASPETPSVSIPSEAFVSLQSVSASMISEAMTGPVSSGIPLSADPSIVAGWHVGEWRLKRVAEIAEEPLSAVVPEQAVSERTTLLVYVVLAALKPHSSSKVP